MKLFGIVAAALACTSQVEAGWRDIDVAGKHFLIRHGGTIRRGVDDVLRVKPFLDEDEDDNIGWNQNLGGGPFRKNPRDSWGQWRL